ncbi:unnamed protein product [Pleuronectes platessa]|uniref:Uncharacterized protein n=1 Tax=Pleuronectes platessa TaxID=8262 RepID=A0A9N7USJ3_PLEPL|nr:unnamed protein product [Pleuronectes platessa]
MKDQERENGHCQEQAAQSPYRTSRSTLYGICREPCQIPETLFKFFFWFGYVNSSLNPVIYTIFNQDFRRAFQKILWIALEMKGCFTDQSVEGTEMVFKVQGLSAVIIFTEEAFIKHHSGC